MRLKLNRAAALTLTGTAILATLNQVGGGAAPRSYIEGQDYKNSNGEQVKADDLDSVTDPSKLSESDFAAGTKWTPAGWTRYANQYQGIAQKSDLKLVRFSTKEEIPVFYENKYEPGLSQYGIMLSFTLNKDDLKPNAKILLATIQNKNSFYKQETKKGPDLDDVGLNLSLTIKGVNIGTVSIYNPEGYEGHNEKDIVLTVDKNFDTKYATNPVGNIYKPYFTDYGGNQTNYDYLQGISDIRPNKNYLITPNRIYTYQQDYTTPTYGNLWTDPNLQYNVGHGESNIGNYPYASGNAYTVSDAQKEVSKSDVHKVIRIKGVNTPTNTLYWYVRYYPKIISADGRFYNTELGYNFFDMNQHDLSKPINAGNNKNATELYKLTKENQLYYSKQDNGDFLISCNMPASSIRALNKDDIIRAMKSNYLYNELSAEQRKQVLDNTIDFYTNQRNIPLISNINIMNSGMDWNSKRLWTLTDETPTNETKLHPTVGGIDANGQNINAELYRTALVHYHDDTQNNKSVANDFITGTKNNATNYILNIPKGYILDTKSSKNVDGKQYKWSTDKKSIAYTFNEDQKLNDANPINIYITHGTHTANDNSGKSTRTIQYTGLPDNLKPKDNVQTVLFKRSGVTDDVTGETTYGDWQPQAGNGHYTAVPSPTFAGYKPDQEVIPDTAATPNKNENVTVNYSRTNQNAKLTVHDDTANTDLTNYDENTSGLYQDQISFKTAPSAVEQELKDKGYNIVSDSFKDSPTYNADDSKNNFVIHVTHKIVPVTPDQPKTPTDVIPDTKQHYPNGVDTNDLNKDVQRSIFYKYEDNSQAEPTVVQKAHFDRTVKVDAVTQKIVDNGTWATKDNYPEVATKSIDGYTPDKTKVSSATPSMTTNQDQTVVYHANDEDAAITYIDDTTGKVLKTDTQKAKYKQAIKFATDPNTQIQTYKDQGYVLVSSDWKDGSTYQTDPARNKFTVHLKHGTSTVTPDDPKTPTDIIPGTKQHYPKGVDTTDLNQSQQRQITYTYADSKKQASPTVTQKATFHRTATIDNVTGKTTYTDWTTSDQYPEVKSPTIEGYTPDKSNVPVTKPELNTKQDVAVIYNPNPEQVDIIAQDNTGKQLSKSTLHGNYNTDYSATTPVIKGYHLIKMPTNTHGTYKTHNDPIIYIYAPDSNSVPDQTDGTPKPDKSSYPNDITPAKRSNKLPETGSINLSSDLNSVANNITYALQHLLH